MSEELEGRIVEALIGAGLVKPDRREDCFEVVTQEFKRFQAENPVPMCVTKLKQPKLDTERSQIKPAR